MRHKPHRHFVISREPLDRPDGPRDIFRFSLVLTLLVFDFVPRIDEQQADAVADHRGRSEVKEMIYIHLHILFDRLEDHHQLLINHRVGLSHPIGGDCVFTTVEQAGPKPPLQDGLGERFKGCQRHRQARLHQVGNDRH